MTLSQGADSVKPIFYALIANFAIAAAKLAAALTTGSGAMMAESSVKQGRVNYW